MCKPAPPPLSTSPTWTVVGATSWGLTLAQQLARGGSAVQVLCRDQSESALLDGKRTIPARAPLVRLPEQAVVTCVAEDVRTSGAVLLAVPAQSMADNVRRIAPFLRPQTILVSAAKGIELHTGRRMSQVLAEESGGRAGSIVALSGPNLADEVARGRPATAVAASRDQCAAMLVQQALTSGWFRVYTHHDILGVELGGALKNIIALGAGISDGMGFGDNAKAAFITRGLAEITRLGVALGAEPLTFAGLSGLGDLIATCASPLSRNRRVGEELGRGRQLAEILATLGHVAEGIATTQAACDLAASLGVSMPITEALARVLFDGWPAADAARSLMERDLRAEHPL